MEHNFSEVLESYLIENISVEAYMDQLELELALEYYSEYDIATESLGSKVRGLVNKFKRSKNKEEQKEIKEEIDENIKEIKEEEKNAETPTEKKRWSKELKLALTAVGTIAAVGGAIYAGKKLAPVAKDVVSNVRGSLAKKKEESGTKDLSKDIHPAVKKAIEAGDKLLVRIQVKDMMVLDPTCKTADKILTYAVTKIPDLYDEHEEADRAKMTNDSSEWDKEYMNMQMVTLVGNFSKERINHLRKVVKHVYPEAYKKFSKSQ